MLSKKRDIVGQNILSLEIHFCVFQQLYFTQKF